MIRFTESVIEAAFRARQAAYPKWNADLYLPVWKLASSAFDERQPSKTAFDGLYSELKGKWQVFRNLGIGTALNADEAWKMLSEMPQRARRLCLSELGAEHEDVVREAVDKARSIKTGRQGASLVAMTKFLHFWNPRLFVIIDREVMANNVLRRLWLKQTLPADFAADADHYVELLQWAAAIVRGNPAILPAFSRHIRSFVDLRSLPEGWETYEATAVEWFLEGVVELQPDGVSESKR